MCVCLAMHHRNCNVIAANPARVYCSVYLECWWDWCCYTRLKWALLYRNKREIKSGLKMEVTQGSQTVQIHCHPCFRLPFLLNTTAKASQEWSQLDVRSWDGIRQRWVALPLAMRCTTNRENKPTLNYSASNLTQLHYIMFTYLTYTGREDKCLVKTTIHY